MELEGSRMTTVTTQSTGSTRLGNEHLLDLASSPGDRFGATFGTAKPSFRSNRDVPGQTVPLAYELGLSISLLPHFGERFSSLCPSGPEIVPFQPLLRCGIAYAEPLGNPFDRQALSNQRLQLVPIQTPTDLGLA